MNAIGQFFLSIFIFENKFAHGLPPKTLFIFIFLYQIFENLVVAWKDDTLSPEHLGLTSDNSILAREDFVVGEPDSFQKELLSGIHFLKDRMTRSLARENDPINNVANTIWSTATAIYDLVSAYFNY